MIRKIVRNIPYLILLVIIIVFLIVIVRVIYGIIQLDLALILSQFFSSIIAVSIPFIMWQLRRNRKVKKLNKIYQQCFDCISEICKIALQSQKEKEKKDDIYDKYLVLLHYKEKIIRNGILIDLVEEIERDEDGSRISGAVVNITIPEEDFNIFLYTTKVMRNVSTADIELNRQKTIDKEIIFKTLENYRKNHSLVWDKEIKKFFS